MITSIRLLASNFQTVTMTIVWLIKNMWLPQAIMQTLKHSNSDLSELEPGLH